MPDERPFTVTELTQRVRGLIEQAVGEVWVEGEISNLRKQASGHQYFTLKDEHCQLPCVLFFRPGLRSASAVKLTEGMLVQARGMMTVYEPRGQYQLNVRLVQPSGEGLLAARFEALKRKLDAQGLFAPERKRSIPKLPRAVGIVTSPTGAAIADMLNILQRRAPWVRVIVNPVRVQGAGAATEIAAAIAEFNAGTLPPVDTLIVARGGGSAEDLWEFNDESVAHAIFDSAIPVISAVGHEIDFTIADFVADLRAPTPSAAAELVAPDAADLQRHFTRLRSTLERSLRERVRLDRARLEVLRQNAFLRDPSLRIRQWMQQIDDTGETLTRLATQRLADKHHRLEKTSGLLRVLAPVSTLSRGYSITRTANGKILRHPAQAPVGTELLTQLAEGEVRSRVE